MPPVVLLHLRSLPRALVQGQRIGLVENGERLEEAMRYQSLDRELAPLDVAFHLQVSEAKTAKVRIFLQKRANAFERRDELSLVVGADDAAAGGKAQRLQHAGVRRAAGRRASILRQRRAGRRPNGQTRGLVELTREVFVLAGVRRRRPAERDAPARRD